jgi:hypothetical protein
MNVILLISGNLLKEQGSLELIWGITDLPIKA